MWASPNWRQKNVSWRKIYSSTVTCKFFSRHFCNWSFSPFFKVIVAPIRWKLEKLVIHQSLLKHVQLPEKPNEGLIPQIVFILQKRTLLCNANNYRIKTAVKHFTSFTSARWIGAWFRGAENRDIDGWRLANFSNKWSNKRRSKSYFFATCCHDRRRHRSRNYKNPK